LSPVTGNTLENKTFWQYTPSGTFEFNSINEEAFSYFRLGEEYRVEITAVPEVERVQAELDFLVAEITSLREKGETLGHWRVGSPEQVAREITDREKLAQPLRARIKELTPPSGTSVES
jgi:hypothetical protein